MNGDDLRRPRRREPGTRRSSTARGAAPALAALLAATAAAASPPDASAPTTAAEPRLLLPQRDASGAASLRIDEGALARYGRAIDVRTSGICRYDEATGRWRNVPWHLKGTPDRFAPDAARSEPRLVLRLAGQPAGLYAASWRWAPAADRPSPLAPDARTWTSGTTLLAHGRVLCNDVMLGPAPPGRVAACIAGDASARATFVPYPVDCE
jgi:hypothetical protein